MTIMAVGFFLLLLGTVLLYFSSLARVRLEVFLTTPSLTVREISANPPPEGSLVAISGKVCCSDPLESPLGNQPCAYYSSRVQERIEEITYQTNRRTNIKERQIQTFNRTLDEQTDRSCFEVDDGTGRIAVDPSGADFDCPRSIDRFQPSEAPARKPTQTPAQTPVQTSAQTTAQMPTQKSAQTLAQMPAQTPAQTPTQKSAQTPAQMPAQTPNQKSAQTPAQTPNQTSAQSPAQTSAQTPAQTSAQSLARTPLSMPSPVLARISASEANGPSVTHLDAGKRILGVQQIESLLKVDQNAFSIGPISFLNVNGNVNGNVNVNGKPCLKKYGQAKTVFLISSKSREELTKAAENSVKLLFYAGIGSFIFGIFTFLLGVIYK